MESQERTCRKLASEKGFVVGKVFKEDWPGDTLDRPQLRQIRDQLKQNAYAALICHATDRLARKPVHLAIIAEECDKTGAQLVFVTEPLDNSPEGQLIRYVKGYAAEIEREKIRERTMRGKKSRAERGMLPQGTGKGTYGYRYNPDTGKREIIESEADVVRRMFKSCADEMSCHSIALALNRDSVPAFAGGKWHPRTVKRVLTNASYKGITFFGQTKRIPLGGRQYKLIRIEPKQWTEIKDATPAIVPVALWDCSQNVLARPRRNPNISGRKYLLTGYIQCECGAPMSGACLNKTIRYYRCRGTWPTAVRPKTCDAPYVRAEQLEEQVWKSVSETLKRPDLIVAEIKRRQGDMSELDQEIERVKKAMGRLEDQERRLVKLYTLAEIDDSFLKKESAQMKKQRVELENEIVKLEKQKRQVESLNKVSDQVREYCAKVVQKLDGFSFEDKRLALKALQVKVVVGKSGVKLFGLIPDFNATIGQTSA